MNLATSKLGKRWSLDMSQYRPESKITGDEGVEIWDVSGCTALFFFSDKSVSAYHIEAGKEQDQVKWATENAKGEGSTKKVVLYSPRYSETDREKETIVRGIVEANSDITDISQNGYWIDTGNRNQRFAFFTQPPEWIIGSEEYDNGEDPPTPPK
ncbi:hypothetical protein SLS60_000387 [Paraconiothyrium brasiliense]|uniref:Uncharacterized protein n=1 Tax=Paraconiothyrium brasiliense TaxID=300254 RepID=A0ABR3S6W7_9PLEO